MNTEEKTPVYQNPILYADYSDPDVIRVGSDFYMVSSSFTYLPGVPLLHSKDLVHWEIINYCVPSLPFAKYDTPAHGSGTWAPSIRYHDGKFVVFVPLPDEGILVSESKDPYGTFQTHLLCRSIGWIDPCPFWDEDGRAWMVFAFAKSRCGIKHRLALIQIDPECTKILSEPRIIFDGTQIAPTSEGPKMYKRNGYYYVLFPAGGVKKGWQACIRSGSLEGPWEYRVVCRQGSTRINGPHQGGWVSAPDGSDWFIHFQDVGALGRIIRLEPMKWVNDFPVIGSDEDGDGIGEPVTEYTPPVPDAPHYQIAESDDFSKDTLGLQWQWQANPDPAWFQLDEKKHQLHLFCRPVRSLWEAGNALTQIPQHRTFDVETKVSLVHASKGDQACLGMLGKTYGYIAILAGKKQSREIAVFCGEVTGDGMDSRAEEKKLLAVPLDGKADQTVTLYCRVLEDSTFTFAFSLDGGQHIEETGIRFPLTPACWTGAKICLWCANTEKQLSGGYGAYDYIHIEDSGVGSTDKDSRMEAEKIPS